MLILYTHNLILIIKLYALYIKAYLIQHIMAKSLRQKRRNSKNKTQRRRSSRKMNGGREFDEQNLHELKDLLDNNNANNNPGHLFALHSDEETCGHCRQFKPEWEKVLARVTSHPDLTVAKMGPPATDYMNEHHYRKHNHTVNGVPTIIYYTVNKGPKEYDGERTADKIIAWLTKVMADNNLEINIKSKSQEHDDASFEPPASDLAPISEPVSEPVSDLSSDLSSAKTDLGSEQQVQDAFPQVPLPPASTLSNATETIKTAAANVDQKIEEGVDAVKSALTSEFDVGEKIGNLFSSATATATATATDNATATATDNATATATDNNNVVAAANPTTSESPDLVPNPVNVPVVPSLVGGVTRRKRRTMRKKSKKSRKYRKARK